MAAWLVTIALARMPLEGAHAQATPNPAKGVRPDATAAAAHPVMRALELQPAAVQQALASVAALAPYAKNFVPFSAADADAALRRGGRHRDHVQPWTIAPAAMAWLPAEGKELWVFSGRSGPRLLIAVLYPLGGGRFGHAASSVIEEADASVAIGYSELYPKQLVWSTCYGCAGEGGTIRFGDDEHVEITYR
jgi:hypothetical protein